jgi:alkylation response protein AidB-like acyl-CoA dehydrogenase
VTAASTDPSSHPAGDADSGIGVAPLQQHEEIRARVAAFMYEEVIPLEAEHHRGSGIAWERLLELRERARRRGVYGPHLPRRQVRLAPARLTHCMRWLGIARRSLDIAVDCANERTSEGRHLGDHQVVQQLLADSAIDLQAARLLVWHAAWQLDRGRPAREETQMAKVFVAEAVNRVVDRAVQVCGS